MIKIYKNRNNTSEENYETTHRFIKGQICLHFQKTFTKVSTIKYIFKNHQQHSKGTEIVDKELIEAEKKLFSKYLSYAQHSIKSTVDIKVM